MNICLQVSHASGKTGNLYRYTVHHGAGRIDDSRNQSSVSLGHVLSRRLNPVSGAPMASAYYVLSVCRKEFHACILAKDDEYSNS
jgi:hypothetical protein